MCTKQKVPGTKQTQYLEAVGTTNKKPLRMPSSISLHKSFVL